jgi:hypothetical protein
MLGGHSRRKEFERGLRSCIVLPSASFALALAILLASAPLRAASPRPRGVGVRLEYERGTGARQCPDATKLRAEVAAEIGFDPFTEAGPWRLRATVAHGKNGGFVATADLLDADGATAFSMGEMASPDCRSLVVKAMAVWIAWQLTDPPLPPPSSPAVSALTPLPPPAPPVPPPPPPAPEPPALRIHLGAATGIELGVGPTPTPLFSLNLAVQPMTTPLLSLAFEAHADLPLPASEGGDVRVHALVLTGSLLACFHPFDDRILYGCPMFTAGFVSGGEHLSTADASGRGVYSAAGWRTGAAIPFSSHRFAFTLTGDVLGTLHPFRLLLEERPVWQTGSVTGAVQAGFFAFL